ncbi:hypothetical protein LTR56_011799 [Elasticomyces elasticus]|nr:hypothetical protein LTR22_024347 [Elasticomyces elasticus]KAK3640707.1 hypothetical protein LTR56_011799 [Elasticomyces elasticus]KAK4929012.1 hypothetical protein LTR49_004209 [Elasticomyces elasticus]KAK5750386.1 hypothetical protein LTS12_019572 [Elasticomyces elasticus]
MDIYDELKREQDRQDKSMEELRQQLVKLSVYGDIDPGPDSGAGWHEVGSPQRYKKGHAYSWRGRMPYDLAGLEVRLLDELRIPQRFKAEIQQWDSVISPTNLKPPRYKYMSSVQAAWCDIVKGYSECDLSFTSDKLVAVAGIAQMISRVTQCRYLAGLWRKDLEHQLMWKVESPLPAAIKNRTRGPSWSWAAVDGGVTWSRWDGGGEHDEIQWLARIESCKVKSITPDSFGQVASGSLVITGPLVVLKVTEDKRPRPNMRNDVMEVCKHGADIFWDSKESYERFGSKSTFAIWNYNTYHASPARDDSSYGDDVFFVPVRNHEL